MKNRVFMDFAFILLLYGIYAAILIGFYGAEKLIGPGAKFLPLLVLAASFFGMLAWYVLGEWCIPPHSRIGTWYATWFLLLAVILLVAAVVAFVELAYTHAMAAPNMLAHPDADSYPILHFVGGLGFFYLASVLFSPANARFLIWPAERVRTW